MTIEAQKRGRMAETTCRLRIHGVAILALWVAAWPASRYNAVAVY